MTPSEEEIVDVGGGEMRPREPVRLKKYVVTEPVTTTVPVQREEIRVERAPIEPDEDDPATASGPGGSPRSS